MGDGTVRGLAAAFLGGGLALLGGAAAAGYALAMGSAGAFGGAALVAGAGAFGGAAGLLALALGILLWRTTSTAVAPTRSPSADPRWTRRVRLVVAPEAGLDTIDAVLGRGGLAPCFESVRRGDEPATAAWRDRSGALAAVYAFSPGVRLRLLELRADLVPGIETALPLLDVGTICDMLAASDRDRLRLGLFAADALAPDDALAPFIEAATILRHHPDPRVAESAIEVRRRLLTRAARVSAPPATSTPSAPPVRSAALLEDETPAMAPAT